MSVPNFQEWFLPLLRAVSDGNIHLMPDLNEQLATDMDLSDSDKAEMLPSGKQFVYRNRIGWARTYLKKAGLLSSPGKTQIQITDRGQKVLSENPAKVDVNYLKQFEEFVEFHSYKAKETQRVIVKFGVWVVDQAALRFSVCTSIPSLN